MLNIKIPDELCAELGIETPEQAKALMRATTMPRRLEDLRAQHAELSARVDNLEAEVGEAATERRKLSAHVGAVCSEAATKSALALAAKLGGWK